MFKRKRNNDYSKFEIEPSDKCLILAPHSDDECIGCGGFLVKYGSQCDVAFLTDGRLGGPEDKIQETISIRNDELKEVMKFLKVNSYKCLNIPDRELRLNLKELEKINLKGYNYVFVPNQHEVHIDHYCVYEKIKKMLKFSKTKLVSYEVWSTLPNPNYYVDISDIINKKKRAIDFYKSQLKYNAYTDRIIALNKYRGIRPNIEYAEAFLIEN